jgi:hypothetical protein
MPENFQKKALEAAAMVANRELSTIEVDPPFGFEGTVSAEDFYVVWFCKTLQNWKALVSTDVVSGFYFEVTYNGDRAETYVDIYQKNANHLLFNSEFTTAHHLASE